MTACEFVANGALAMPMARARPVVADIPFFSFPLSRPQSTSCLFPGGRVATIAVNSFVFKQPVFVGDLLSFYADIVKTGNTSVTIEVTVYAQRMSLAEEVVKVTEATLTYVATDSDRRPRALPSID